MMSNRVAIIGAGPSGLAAIKCCLDEGLIPVCFEQDSDIGGLWNYSAELKEGKATVYKSCVINTSKEMFAYSDFPVPAHFPPFMSHNYVIKYLRMYAEEFKLLRHIRFNTGVEFVRKAPSYAETGRWEVGYSREQSEEFDAVMVCSGHHVHPNLPEIPGAAEFKGQQIHSHDYRIPEPFTDKTVVVMGVGNSAVDIAVDLSRVTSQVYLSTRRGAWVVSRMGPFGIPMDVLANSRCAFALPRPWLQRMVEIMANQRFDHEAMGLSPTYRVLESHPTINDELPLRILTGSVKVVNDVKSLSEDAAVFTDGDQRHVDTVIYATGYDYRCPFIDNDVIDLSDNHVDLYKFMFPPKLRHGTLAMIGLVQPVGAFPPVSEMQSRWFTQLLTGKVKLPGVSVMEQEVANKRHFLDANYYKSKKHTCETFWIQYMDEIAEQFGAKPNFRSLFLKDPWLAARCYFGPCVPPQYRLQGPGTWSGAKEAISRSFTNNTEATRTRKGNQKAQQNKSGFYWDCLLVLFVIGLLLCIYDTGMFIK